MPAQDRSQSFIGIKRQRDMILDVEAGFFTHILHVVRQVPHQAFFTQFWRNCGFQSYHISALFSSYETRASSCNYLYLIRSKFDLLTLDREIDPACLVEYLSRLIRPMCLQPLKLV